MAAKRTVCFFAEMNLARSSRAGVSWRPFFLFAFLTCFAVSLIQARDSRLEEKSAAEHERYLFHANLDVNSLTEKIDEFPPEPGAAAQTAGNAVVDQIVFEGTVASARTP